MHDVPQSNLLNPAVQLKCKWFVGIPVLTSTQLNYSNTTFSLNELYSLDGTTVNIKIDKFYENLRKTNMVNTEVNFDLFSLGYRRNEYYVTFNISEKMNLGVFYPGELVNIIWKGNSQFLGETAKFNNLRLNTIYYREYGLGASKVWDSYTTIGVRAKLLFGKAGSYFGKTKLSIYTDENTFNLHIEGDISANISFPMTIDQDADGNISGISMGEIDPLRLLMNSKNKGFAVDLGAIHEYTKRIKLSASVLDLGFVGWKSDVNNISIKGEFDYTGTDVESDLSGVDFATSLSDSIINAFNNDVTQEKYYQWLPLQIYLGGTYRYKPKLAIGAVNRNVIYRNKLHSSLTLSANTTVWNKLSASLSWSYLNNTYKNVGLGLAWHSRGLQFHMVSDNVLAAFKPLGARTLNLRFGFGVMLGCPKDKEEEVNIYNPYSPMNKGNCFWAKKMDKYYKIVLKKKKKREKKIKEPPQKEL